MPGLPGLLNAIFGSSALARNEIRSQPSPFAAKSLGRLLGRGPTLGLIRWRACPPATGAGTSLPAGDRAIVDAGLKALAFDSGPPVVCDEPAATYERTSDEHGRLAVSVATNRLGLGDKIRLISGRCDRPTPTLPSPARGGGLG
jgi:hypothetical protein